MGSYLDKPITEKHSEIDAANGLAFGASAMQGWRVEMEDSHTIITAIGESYALCSSRILLIIMSVPIESVFTLWKIHVFIAQSRCAEIKT